ncbi:MAG: cysteine rich repeat-containing protein [Deltaproteobacteria bacterium]
MKRTLVIFTVLVVFLMTGATAMSDPVKTFEEGCKVELEKYCSLVTPGDGRLLGCLFAYQDKLSAKCEYAVYDAAVQLERAVAALTYVANECDDDLEKYCSDVAPGEGRLKECIDKNMAKVSDRCKGAMKDVGLE